MIKILTLIIAMASACVYADAMFFMVNLEYDWSMKIPETRSIDEYLQYEDWLRTMLSPVGNSFLDEIIMENDTSLLDLTTPSVFFSQHGK